MTRRRLRWFGLLMIILGAAALRTGAQTVTVGNNNAAPNCIPFGCPSPFTNIPGYQQVFASTLFSQAVAISELDFFRNSAGGNVAGGTFNLFLGYTNAAIGGLSSNLASNRSGPMTLFASFVGGGSAPSTLALVGGPFVYDPTMGNLLMEVDNSTWTEGSSNFNASITSLCSRAVNSTFNGASNNFADGRCLDTELHYSPVVATPEPSTIALVASGIAGLGGFARRRRKG
jgi:hypothetical protein